MAGVQRGDVRPSPLQMDTRWGWGVLETGGRQEDAAGWDMCSPEERVHLGGGGGLRGCVEREPLASEMFCPCQAGTRQPPSPYQGSWDLTLGESGKAFWGIRFTEGRKKAE